MEYIEKLYSQCKKKLDDEYLNSLHYLCNTSQEEHEYIALRMNLQLEYIHKHNDDWLKRKLNDFFNSEEIKAENFNGLLGEIRSYGELLELKSRVKEISTIKTPSSGSDFLITFKNQNIRIEVNTPQQSGSKIIQSEIEEKTTTTGKNTLKFNTSTTAPYGYPVRAKDNIQYEAVSKFAQIKTDKEGKQFTKEDISILWLDLNNPKIFMFNQLEYTTPILSFNGQITSGFLWNAFYSLKRDYIYSDYSGFSSNIIKMEFDGRFETSNIDFVIIDCFTHKVIFENHNSLKKIPQELYKAFFQIHNLNNQNSVLSYNKKDKLIELIKTERDFSNSVAELY